MKIDLKNEKYYNKYLMKINIYVHYVKFRNVKITFSKDLNNKNNGKIKERKKKISVVQQSYEKDRSDLFLHIGLNSEADSFPFVNLSRHGKSEHRLDRGEKIKFRYFTKLGSI